MYLCMIQQEIQSLARMRQVASMKCITLEFGTDSIRKCLNDGARGRLPTAAAAAGASHLCIWLSLLYLASISVNCRGMSASNETDYEQSPVGSQTTQPGSAC